MAILQCLSGQGGLALNLFFLKRFIERVRIFHCPFHSLAMARAMPDQNQEPGAQTHTLRPSSMVIPCTLAGNWVESRATRT